MLTIVLRLPLNELISHVKTIFVRFILDYWWKGIGSLPLDQFTLFRATIKTDERFLLDLFLRKICFCFWRNSNLFWFTFILRLTHVYHNLFSFVPNSKKRITSTTRATQQYHVRSTQTTEQLESAQLKLWADAALTTTSTLTAAALLMWW